MGGNGENILAEVSQAQKTKCMLSFISGFQNLVFRFVNLELEKNVIGSNGERTEYYLAMKMAGGTGWPWTLMFLLKKELEMVDTRA